MNAKWCLGRYLKILQIVTYQELQKRTKILSKKLDFKDIKLSVKARDIHKIEKKEFPSALVFLVLKIKKNIQFMYQKKFAKKKMLIYYS